MTHASGPLRILLLAGSVGPERLPARPDRGEPRWFEPLHVRDPRQARERMAGQAVAGADVVVAPTWQTHRRALVPVGETRQARAWTGAAVRVAREAIELGLEQRAAEAQIGARRDADAADAQVGRRADPDADAQVGDGPERRAEDVAEARDAEAPDAEVRSDGEASETQALTPPLPRPVPLVAASLPALDDTPEPGVGRLLPRQAASERDYREQAGLLADQEPDLLLVEGQATTTELRLATEAAVGTGLPVWVAVTVPGLDGDEIDQAMDTLGGLDVAALLLSGQPGSSIIDLPVAWGGLVRGVRESEAWLDAGAMMLGLLDRATNDRVAAVRVAIDQRERAAVEAARRVDDVWWAHVRRAAAMAQGGSALWLRAPDEAVPAPGDLPPGFEWLVVDDREAFQVPEGRFSLVVDRHGGPDAAERDARWLAEGGILTGAAIPVGSLGSELRVLSMDDQDGLRFAILRRDG